MSVQPLEEIEVFKLSEEIADGWWEIVSEWSPFAKDTVGKQIVRAADSIGANIAESYGRYHFGEKINHLYYSRGSLYEAKFFARRARKRKLVSEETYNQMIRELGALAPMLNSYINSKKAQRKNV
ncbi:MAG: four helix bundle protein [Chloroflexi bacterium]|nr:four helix bundle protein [Chloroflexota bacterium]